MSRQLAAWGDRPDEARPRMTRLEQDLERVLEDLVENFPLLRSLVDRRPGGQKRLRMPGRGDERVPASLFATSATDRESGGDVEPATGGVVETPEGPSPSPPEPFVLESRSAEGQHGEANEPRAPAGDQPHSHTAAAGALETVAGRRRPAPYGLLMQFESRPGDPELGRLVDNTIWINDVHPAYLRAVASRSLGYHTALAVALALAPLAVERHDEHAFARSFWRNGAPRRS